MKVKINIKKIKKNLKRKIKKNSKINLLLI